MNKNIKIFTILAIFSVMGLFKLNSMDFSSIDEVEDFQTKWVAFTLYQDEPEARRVALEEIDTFLSNVSPSGRLAIMPLLAGQNDNLNNHPAFTVNFADAQAVFIKHGFLENVTVQDILGTQASNNQSQAAINNPLQNPAQNSNSVFPPNPPQLPKKSENFKKIIKGGVIAGLSIAAIGLVVYLYKKYQDKKARDTKNQESEEIESDIILMEK